MYRKALFTASEVSWEIKGLTWCKIPIFSCILTIACAPRHLKKKKSLTNEQMKSAEGLGGLRTPGHHVKSHVRFGQRDTPLSKWSGCITNCSILTGPSTNTQIGKETGNQPFEILIWMLETKSWICHFHDLYCESQMTKNNEYPLIPIYALICIFVEK